MKKIILFILLFCATKSFAQFPINAAQGTQTTTVLTRGISASDSGYWYRTAFADTTALNRGRIDEIAGVVARTSDNSLWLRNNTATRWIQLSGGSGSVNIYNSDGTQTGNRIVTGGGYTLAFDAQSSIRLQPSGSNRTSLLYMDIDSIRLEPPFGILTIDSLASGASTDSVLVWTQATGRVKKRSYSSFTPTWQQTLTAGSTLTGDNTIAGGGNSILWNGFNDFEVLSSGAQLFKADFGGYSAQVGVTQGLSVTIGTYDVGIPGHNSALEIYADSIGASPYSGRYAIDTLNNLSNQNTLLGRVNNISAPNGNGHGNIGYVTLGSGLSLSSGVLNTSGTVPTPISSLTAATGTNSITVGHPQTWNYNGIQSTTGHTFTSNSITSGTIMDITGISSFLAAGNEGLNIGISGANATNGITATGARISVTNTNATSGTNVGLDLTASGATTANNALNIAAGAIALNGSAGTSGQVLTSAGASGLPTWTTPTTGTVTGSGTANQVTYWNGSSSITGDAGFTRLTNEINLTQSSAGVDVAFRAKNTSTSGGYTTAAMIVENSSSFGELFKSGTGYVGYKTIAATDLGFYNTGGNISILNDYASGNINFSAGGNSTAAMTINTSNNVGIGTSTPSAYLHLKAGTATASTAPLKFTTGTLNTTAEAGAFEYTTPQLFFTNGAAIRQEIPQIQQARVSTQYDNTTTTLGTVTGLTTNVAAGKTYRFEAVLYTTSNVAGGVKFAMAGTATATNIIYEAVVIDNNVNAAQTRATALATTVGAVTAVTNAYAKITGTITVNAAGTFLVQAAANAAVGTTSVLVGSTFVITEML